VIERAEVTAFVVFRYDHRAEDEPFEMVAINNKHNSFNIGASFVIVSCEVPSICGDKTSLAYKPSLQTFHSHVSEQPPPNE